jgi:hypothetical protein
MRQSRYNNPNPSRYFVACIAAGIMIGPQLGAGVGRTPTCSANSVPRRALAEAFQLAGCHGR